MGYGKEAGIFLSSLGNAAMSAITQYQMMEYMKKKPEDQNKEIIPESQKMAKALADVNEVNQRMKKQANPDMEEEVVVEQTVYPTPILKYPGFNQPRPGGRF